MPYGIKWLGILFAILVISGCGEPTLDTSSQEASRESAREVLASLSESDKEKFKKTVAGIYRVGALVSFGSDISKEEAMSKIDAKLHGKTAEEIFQLAADIREKMER